MEPDWGYDEFLHAASLRLELGNSARRVFNANGTRRFLFQSYFEVHSVLTRMIVTDMGRNPELCASHRVGVEVNDCMMISDNDLLFLSCGEDFIGLTAVRRDASGSGKTDPAVASSRRGSRLTEIGPYTIGDLLGKGGFGEVRVGTNNLTGDKVALKFMKKSEIINLGAAERTATELQCLSLLKHPHIIFLHTVSLSFPA